MDQPPEKMTYRSAGLDLDAYEQSLQAMAPFLRRTHTPRVLDGFGGFASLFSLDFNTRLFARNYKNPVLVSCTDGVGTKLRVAMLMNRHDTVGIDLVAMSVNDCLCTGGEPLLFLDYLAMPKDDPERTEIYVDAVRSVLANYPVKHRVIRGLAHITGEGLEGNVPRVVPPGRRALIDRKAWERPPVFGWLQRLGGVDEAEMYRVFNMG